MIKLEFKITITEKGGSLETGAISGGTEVEQNVAIALKEAARKAFQELAMTNTDGEHLDFITAEDVSQDTVKLLKQRIF